MFDSGAVELEFVDVQIGDDAVDALEVGRLFAVFARQVVPLVEDVDKFVAQK